jgi:hypothetical protein
MNNSIVGDHSCHSNPPPCHTLITSKSAFFSQVAARASPAESPVSPVPGPASAVLPRSSSVPTVKLGSNNNNNCNYTLNNMGRGNVTRTQSIHALNLLNLNSNLTPLSKPLSNAPNSVRISNESHFNAKNTPNVFTALTALKCTNAGMPIPKNSHNSHGPEHTPLGLKRLERQQLSSQRGAHGGLTLLRDHWTGGRRTVVAASASTSPNPRPTKASFGSSVCKSSSYNSLSLEGFDPGDY